MDTIVFMFLAALGIICWIVGAARPLSPLWVKIGVAPAIVFVLVPYFLLLLWRSQPELWNGNAEAGWPTVVVIALGIYAAIAERKPKSKNNGGLRSA